jgi:hypothetical protein
VLDHPCRVHRIVGMVLTAVLSLLLLFAGSMKLFGPPPPPEMPLSSTTIHVLGVIDLLLAVGLWLPRVSTLSFVLTVGYFGGATATNLTQPGQGPWLLTAVIIAYTLVAAYFKAPELFLRALGKGSPGEGAACAVPPKA